MHTGTNAIVAMLTNNYNANVCNGSWRSGKSGNVHLSGEKDGTSGVGVFATRWKHSVGTLTIPLNDLSNRPIVVVYCVRELSSWLASLAIQPYSIRKRGTKDSPGQPYRGERRAGDEKHKYWVFENILVPSQDAIGGDAMFDSAVEMYWAEMALLQKGQKFVTPDGKPFPRVVVSRHEDITYSQEFDWHKGELISRIPNRFVVGERVPVVVNGDATAHWQAVVVDQPGRADDGRE